MKGSCKAKSIGAGGRRGLAIIYMHAYMVYMHAWFFMLFPTIEHSQNIFPERGREKRETLYGTLTIQFSFLSPLLRCASDLSKADSLLGLLTVELPKLHDKLCHH